MTNPDLLDSENLRTDEIDPARSFHCPKCGIALRNWVFEGIKGQLCTDCCGLWMEKVQWETLAQADITWVKCLAISIRHDLTGTTKSALDSEQAQHLREVYRGKCPRCSAMVVKKNHLGTAIERCRCCDGAWLYLADFDRIRPVRRTLREAIKAAWGRLKV